MMYHAIGQCWSCKAVYRVDIPDTVTSSPLWRGDLDHLLRERNAGATCATCTNVHDKPLPVKFTAAGIIRATVTSKPCNEACTNSRTSRCSCSCGGDNHGIVHQAHGRTVDAIQRMDQD